MKIEEHLRILREENQVQILVNMVAKQNKVEDDIQNV